jgi:hypothetical protein
MAVMTSLALDPTAGSPGRRCCLCLETCVAHVLNQHTVPATTVMSQESATPGPANAGPGCCSFRGFAAGSLRGSGGLVDAAGFEGRVAEEFAGGGVDDAGLKALDEQDDQVPAWVRPMPMWWSRLR